MHRWRAPFAVFLLLTSSLQAPEAHAEITPCMQMPTREHPLSVRTTRSAAEIPDPMKKPPTVTPLGCDRPFVYRGEVYSADSPQAQDASTLREFVKSVPEADAVLEEYQSNRSKSRISAYTGTIGILLAVLSSPLSKTLSKSDPDSIKTAFQIGGLAIAAGGFFYSFTLLRTNEHLLPKAVEAYNQAKPNDGIELKFTTGWTF